MLENQTKNRIAEELKTAEADVAENIKAALEGAGEGVRVHKDLTATKEDLEAIEDVLIETTLKVARRSEETAEEVLTDLVGQTERTTFVLKEKTGHAAENVTARPKEAGKEVAQTTMVAAGKVTHIITEEAMELGKRSVDVAKGAISGMRKGADDVLQKGKDNRGSKTHDNGSKG